MVTSIFKEGMRVKAKVVKEPHDSGHYAGFGKIVNVSVFDISVEFDNEFTDGHRGNENKGKNGHTWNFKKTNALNYLEIVNEESIDLEEYLKKQHGY